MNRENLEIEGVVHGKRIELASDAGLPDGQRVKLAVSLLCTEDARIPGDGLRRAFAAWAEDADDLEQYLDWNRQQRKLERPDL